MSKKLAALFAASVLIAPLVASAQDVPSYAEPETSVERIQGRIVTFDGAYDLSVRDERGFVDHVRIHPGTIINPTGITLQAGMVVSIIGENDGYYFSGDEVDTPYTLYGSVPYYSSHPWYYYGAGVGLGFFFGSLMWWHGDYFGHYPYGWAHGYRYYSIPHYRFGEWGRFHGGYYGGYHGYGGHFDGPRHFGGGERFGGEHFDGPRHFGGGGHFDGPRHFGGGEHFGGPDHFGGGEHFEGPRHFGGGERFEGPRHFGGGERFGGNEHFGGGHHFEGGHPEGRHER